MLGSGIFIYSCWTCNFELGNGIFSYSYSEGELIPSEFGNSIQTRTREAQFSSSAWYYTSYDGRGEERAIA